jgi:glycosyltransferase involved in cell wall biosynthesis
MKVGFDARMISHPGIGRYTRSILSAILSQDKNFKFLLYGSPQELNTFTNAEIKNYQTPIYSLKEYFFSPFGKDALDLLHIPHFNAPFNSNLPLVVTVHDLIYLKFPESSPWLNGKIVKFIFANTIKKAKRIIAVSENTKSDILKFFPEAKDKVKVIYEAADKAFKRIDDQGLKNRVREKYNLPDNIILSVGSLKKHKNLESLLDAYLSLKTKNIKHKLLMVGRFRPREAQILKKLNASGAIYIGEVPLEDLVVIYNLADLFIIPSLYEGFGLPVLEAMACGVAVACSKASSLPEVADEAAYYFNPYDQKDIENAIWNVISNQDLRMKLINKGFENLKKFSWDKSAKETMEVYREAYSK